METPQYKAAGYMKQGLDRDCRDKLVAKIGEMIRLRGFDFSAVVCRGVSGTLLGSAVAYYMRKDLIVVRKPNETSHSSFRVEGLRNVKAIFIDDLIDSGSTINDVVITCMKELNTKVVFAYMWYQDIAWDIDNFEDPVGILARNKADQLDLDWLEPTADDSNHEITREMMVDKRGIIWPIKVRKVGENKYKIVDGNKRYWAVRRLTLRTQMYCEVIYDETIEREQESFTTTKGSDYNAVKRCDQATFFAPTGLGKSAGLVGSRSGPLRVPKVQESKDEEVPL